MAVERADLAREAGQSPLSAETMMLMMCSLQTKPTLDTGLRRGSCILMYLP